MKKQYIYLVAAVIIIAAAFLIFRNPESIKLPLPSPSPSPLPDQEQPEPKTPTQPTIPPTTSKQTKPAGTVATQNQGRVVFAVTDASVPFTNVESVILMVNELAVHSPTKGWITILKDLRAFDLLKLRKNPLLAFLADTKLDPGTYNQVRLLVEKVTVTSGGQTQEAKLPSGDLKLITKLVVTKGENSSVVFDFLLDKSLHTTTDGKYIFLPVIKLQTQSVLKSIQIRSGELTIPTGTIDSDATIGMDENGNTKNGFSFNPATEFELEGEKIKVKPQAN